MSLRTYIIAFIATVVVALAGSNTVCAQTRATLVDGPDKSVASKHYVSSRAPLQPASFIKLPLGDVAPKWPTTELYPATPWNYALVTDGDFLRDMKMTRKPWPADNYPFTLESVPLEFKAKGVRIPSWQIDEHGLCAVLPNAKAERSKEVEEITLVPMGAARLRISAFPQTDPYKASHATDRGDTP